MKKNFKSYLILWAILLAAFNVIVFLVRPVLPGYVIIYDARFWLAWAFINLAFVGNLVCAWFAFKAENAKKLFYNLPLITLSWSALIVMLIVGAGLMLIPDCQAWIAAIVCVLVLAFNAIAVVKAGWAAETVEKVDEKIKAKTQFIKTLTVDAETLCDRAKSDEAKAACKKVFEAIRYSDPMSNDALAEVENRITQKFNEFSEAVTTGTDNIEAVADELVALVGERNKKCKLVK